MYSKAKALHNGTVYALMDTQVCDHDIEAILAQRIAGDTQEAEVLRSLAGLACFVPGRVGDRIRTRVRWLLNFDHSENSDHDRAKALADERRLAERQICKLLEFGTNGSAATLTSDRA